MNTKKDVIDFTNKLCLQFGICDPMYELDRFASREHYQANEFIKEFFIYEGMDADIEIALFRQAKNLFIEHFGSHEINIV